VNEKRDGFFNKEAYNIYKDHLPVNLYSRLILIGLMDKKQIEHKLDEKRVLTFKLSENQNSVLPNSVSISIINTYLSNESELSNQLITKKAQYTFCKKNIASWCIIDNNVEDSGDNSTAYAMYENPFLKVQTDQYVKNINLEANKVIQGVSKPKSGNYDACSCTIF